MAGTRGIAPRQLRNLSRGERLDDRPVLDDHVHRGLLLPVRELRLERHLLPVHTTERQVLASGGTFLRGLDRHRGDEVEAVPLVQSVQPLHRVRRNPQRALARRHAGNEALASAGGHEVAVREDVARRLLVVEHAADDVGQPQHLLGHGLGVAPSMVIIKNRTLGTENWAVYHVSTGAAYWLLLSGTNAAINNTTIWNNTTPTSSSISLGALSNTNVAGSNFVGYFFAEVAGFSKFGSYTGNGSSDGTFVYTGMRPRYVLLKRTDSTSDWVVFDTSRDPYNVAVERLYPNLSDAEGVSGNILDFLSNGFKFRSANYNVSGGTYIFAAFAESPFNYSRAR